MRNVQHSLQKQKGSACIFMPLRCVLQITIRAERSYYSVLEHTNSVSQTRVIACCCVLCCLQVFSVVVFGCITDQGWFNGMCIYRSNADACHFGNAVGIIAFLALMAFLALDAVFDNISNVMHRKYIVMADVIFSGNLSLLQQT